MVWQTLDDARAEALGCTKCRLSEGRTQVVWMDGNPSSRLMFIGEAPGFHEDRQGLPFVGAAGKLLNDLLGEIGLTRNDCTICNVLKCRPPGNRDPLPEEIDSCRPYLESQIRFIAPDVIVTLGNFATRFVLGTTRGITSLRGETFEAYDAVVIPTFHPAAALHGGGAKSPVAASMRDDFQRVAEALKQARAKRQLEDDAEPALEQASLF